MVQVIMFISNENTNVKILIILEIICQAISKSKIIALMCFEIFETILVLIKTNIWYV